MSSVSKVFDATRSALASLMETRGWQIDPMPDRAGALLLSCRRSIDNEFSAAAAFVRSRLTVPDHLPLVVSALIGVSYDPLHRLWPSLKDHIPWAEVTVDAGRLESGGSSQVEIKTRRDVPSASKYLAELVFRNADDFSREYATVESLLEANAADPDTFDWEIEVLPAILAAAGRNEAARAAMTRYEREPEGASEEYRQFMRRLTAWLDSCG